MDTLNWIHNIVCFLLWFVGIFNEIESTSCCTSPQSLSCSSSFFLFWVTFGHQPVVALSLMFSMGVTMLGNATQVT